MTGVIRDPDAGTVVEAAIVIRNEDTGVIRTTTTDRTGRFSLRDLPIGNYTVEVVVPGFDIMRRNRVAVTSDRADEITIRLEHLERVGGRPGRRSPRAESC